MFWLREMIGWLLVAVGLIFFVVSRFVPLDRVLGQK